MTGTPTTLPELLYARSKDSTAEIGFLDSQGHVVETLSYSNLYDDATTNARRLIAAGLKPGSDIVVTSFSDHKSHIRVLWACLLVGIPICVLPNLHPDPSRRILFFQNIQSLFSGPKLIAHQDTVDSIKATFPDIDTLSLQELESQNITDVPKDAVFPERCIKSDDIACLVLTSGSTGNSKAVVLRHSNILSSIRGKIKHHDTRSDSRFLNWISFDHVASISEAHLQALEVNASQYHVESSAIVHRPRNLLEWCSRLRITNTFSPNFLLAQICRDIAAAPCPDGELDLSQIRTFISGGEAVPVKTAVEFADIIERYGAPRDALRAGFGMSETGAGCIYDTRPIVRDTKATSEKYLSLGKCCPGTTMRIISQTTGAPCAVSEVGQLQLRGPTVFREYYADAKSTAASFTPDGWFVTGDNAYLDQDGDLHMVGRDRDYVNINGIKRPSVDIEHFIEDSAIDGVMRSFVFVCVMRLPDMDTETYAVFYQHTVRVEDGDLGAEDLLAISETNRAIRNTCIIFCQLSPYIVLPLPRQSFVKTALGKVSRSALVTSYLAGAYADFESRLKTAIVPSLESETTPSNDVEQVVFEAITWVLGQDTSAIQRSQNIFDIGVTSMHFMQLKHVFEERLGIRDLQTIELLKRSEVGQLCDYLYHLRTAR